MIGGASDGLTSNEVMHWRMHLRGPCCGVWRNPWDVTIE
jgi:hypothetical protein